MKDYLRQVILLCLSPLLTFTLCHAQGNLKGKVIDDSEEPILFGNVALYKGGKLIKGIQTDFDGNYLISNVDLGTYDLEVSYVGFQAKKITEIRIANKETKLMDVQLFFSEDWDHGHGIIFKKELFNKGETSTGSIITSEEIRRMAF